MKELILLAKETLGIVSTATAKDKSLEMIINSAIDDMKRAGLKTEISSLSSLEKNAIMTYVKANFGISNPNDKEKYFEAYRLHLHNLCLSENFKEANNND